MIDRVSTQRCGPVAAALYSGAMPRENPYNWTTDDPDPAVTVSRAPLIEEAAAVLRAGRGAYVLGGRGLGKSVFVHQLAAHLQAQADTRVVVLAGPPAPRTLDAALQAIARELGLTGAPGVEPRLDRLIEEYMRQHGDVR